MSDTVDAQAPELRTPGFCALCKSRCGSTMVTQGGRLLRQEPLPQHPTGKALCVKGKAAPEIVYRESRELYPLRRTRPKGDADPGWQRISWDEALQLVADALLRQKAAGGAESVAFGVTTPSGTPIADDLRWIERLANAFGSPNMASGTEICNWHKDSAHEYTFGRGISSPDFAQTGCIVLWGHNPSATWLDHATATNAALARGAKLMVVDPRRAGLATRAHQWLRVRPGSDGALALGLARELMRQGWIDATFLARWSNGPLLVRTDNGRFLRAGEVAALGHGGAEGYVGVDADGQLMVLARGDGSAPWPDGVSLDAHAVVPLRDGSLVACTSAFGLYRSLCDEWTPERVEAVCWVPAAQVAEAACLLHENGPVSYYAWSGVGQHTNATQTDRALALLMALTGSFDAPGGNVQFGKPKSRGVSGHELLAPEQRAKCIELARSPLGPGRIGSITIEALSDAVLHQRPYKIGALVNFGRNFLVNHADGERTSKALAALDFMVHCDVVMNPTATYADVFLPINTPWEREALRVGFEGSEAAEALVQLRQKAIEPRGESRSDAWVVFELGQRLGLGAHFWNGDIEQAMAHMLEPSGVTLAELRAQPAGVSVPTRTEHRRYERTGFATATGKLEIYSERFLLEGQLPLPAFLEPASSPLPSVPQDYPLVLTSAKVVQFCHGQHRDVPSLRKRSPVPEVSLHPHAAAARGIVEGISVRLRTSTGSATFKARLDANLDERVVCAQYGWWQGNPELGFQSQPALGEGSPNFNRIVSGQERDPVSGSVGLRSSMCEIEPLD